MILNRLEVVVCGAHEVELAGRRPGQTLGHGRRFLIRFMGVTIRLSEELDEVLLRSQIIGAVDSRQALSLAHAVALKNADAFQNAGDARADAGVSLFVEADRPGGLQHGRQIP